MMLTQIIAGDALEEVNSRLRTLARIHRSEGGPPPSPDTRRGTAAAVTNGGAKKEADFKEEEEVKWFFNIYSMLWIRIRIDFGRRYPDPGWQKWSAIIEKSEEILSVLSLLRAEDFSCQLKCLHL